MIIERSEIAEKLGKLKSVVPAKTEFEGIKGVLFKDNRLTAYNLELGVISPLKVETEEQFVLPARAIEMIENLPNGPMEITADEKNQVVIKTGGIKNKLLSTPADKFPEVEIVDDCIGSFSIKGGELFDAISAVLYAVPAQNTKPQMTGVLFDSHDGYLNIVGCDGYRMAWSRGIRREWKNGVIVPAVVLEDGNRQIEVTGKELLFGDFSEGRYAWKLANPVLFEKPIPARGHQGFWKWEEGRSA